MVVAFRYLIYQIPLRKRSLAPFFGNGDGRLFGKAAAFAVVDNEGGSAEGNSLHDMVRTKECFA
jgi:hypothetical protein